jgi:aminopeptidase N
MRRFSLRLLVFSAILLCSSADLALAQRPASRQRPDVKPPAATTQTEPLRTASDRPIDIKHIKLDLRVDLDKKTVNSKADIQFRCIRPTKKVVLDAVDFDLKEVTLQTGDKPAAPAAHTYDGKKLTVDLGSLWPTSQAGALHIAYKLVNPKNGLFFQAPNKDDADEPLMLWSQGETLTNRYWIPSIDEPDQRQTTEVIVTVPKDFEAVSNGKLLERRENSDNTVTFHWRQDIPHPIYLVTLVVRQFDVVHQEWDGIPVDFYLPKGRKADAIPTYGRTREMLAFFSERFGVHYPWVKYAQVSVYGFPGGMENTSATSMTENILLDERSLLDRTSEWIVSHELAHQWWGDMVTCRDWSHTWLNEGFASYAEVLWDEHRFGADGYARNLFEKADRAIAEGKTRPVMDRHYTTPDSMFDGRSYPKGAWALHMLRRKLGDEAFFLGIKNYATQFKFQSAETMDFRRSLEHTTGRGLERFFYDWLERPGNPDLEVTTEYKPDAKLVQFTVKQAQEGEAFHIPIKVAVYHSGSSMPIIVEEEMTNKEITLKVPVPGAPTRVDVDPDMAVLTDLKETKGRDLWQAQLLHGPSVPARIRAARHFAESKKDEDRTLLAQALSSEEFWTATREIAKALGKASGPISREALLKGLGHADARIRAASIESLGAFATDPAVIAALKEILERGDPSYGVESAALKAYAKTGQADALATIRPWLDKPSHDHELAAAAVEAVAATNDLAALPILMDWAKQGRPNAVRGAARRGLISLTKNKKLTEDQRQQIVKFLVESLEQSQGLARFQLIMALPELGTLAAPALPVIDRFVNEAPGGLLNGFAKNVADGIRAKLKPASNVTAAESTEAKKLRDQLKRLQDEETQVRDQLKKYEKAGASK